MNSQKLFNFQPLNLITLLASEIKSERKSSANLFQSSQRARISLDEENEQKSKESYLNNSNLINSDETVVFRKSRKKINFKSAPEKFTENIFEWLQTVSANVNS